MGDDHTLNQWSVRIVLQLTPFQHTTESLFSDEIPHLVASAGEVPLRLPPSGHHPEQPLQGTPCKCMHFGTILLHFALIQQLIVFMEQQAPPGTRTGGERAGEAEGHAWEHHEGLRPIGLWEQHDPGAQVAEEANLVKMLEEREREARMAVRLFWLVMFFFVLFWSLLLSRSCTRELSGICCSIQHIPAKWASLKHDEVGSAWACALCSSLASGPSCQARHDPFDRAWLGLMVGLISPAARLHKKWYKIFLLHYLVWNYVFLVQI
jgi:hypothetical protein